MRVMVATGALPLVHGGAEILAHELVGALRRHGHQADLAPFLHRPFGGVTAAYLQPLVTNLTVSHDGHPVERLISLRYPAYGARHPGHVCWMVHRLRPYYDLWQEFYQSLSSRPKKWKERLRRALIHAWDRRCLRRTQKIYALSRQVQQRLAASGLQSEVLYPPARDGLEYKLTTPGSTFLAVSRLDRNKRLHLFIEALHMVPGATGVIVGCGPLQKELKAKIVSLGLGSRLKLVGRVPDEELSRFYLQARAVVFPPFQEEFGYVALEAMTFGRAVVTTDDSGGPAELIRHLVNGCVVPPSAPALAHEMERLLQDPVLAGKLGLEAFESRPQGDWPEVIQKLLTTDDG